MRLLLDTHILLWALVEPARLDFATRETIQDRGNDVAFSAVSIWEIAIKSGLGRAEFPFQPNVILQEALAIGFVEIPIRSAEAAMVASLPLHHSDPFDRLLVAQAIAGPARLYTADQQLVAYSELVTLVRQAGPDMA